LVSKADLSMRTPEINGDAIIRQPVDFSVVVVNDGLIPAEGVTITGHLVELNMSASSLPLTILPNSNESITILFDTDEIVAGVYTFTFTLDAGSTPLVETPEVQTLSQVKFSPQSNASSTNIVPFIIIGIFAIGIYMFIRSRRSGSGPGF